MSQMFLFDIFMYGVLRGALVFPRVLEHLLAPPSRRPWP